MNLGEAAWFRHAPCDRQPLANVRLSLQGGSIERSRQEGLTTLPKPVANLALSAKTKPPQII